VHAGLQLYTLSDQFREDPEGTLRLVASLGFGEVELAGLDGRDPRAIRKSLDDAGLICRSAHLIYLAQPDVEAGINAASELGLTYLVAPIPWKRDLSGITPEPGGGPYAFALAVVNNLTLDDWKWNADLLNRTGERLRAAGLQLAYHNHNFDFRDFGGVRGYDEMLRLTDPELVKLELDAGWIRVAGIDPLDYLNRYANRVRLLHVRDFAPGFDSGTHLSLADAPAAAPVGRGVVDYESIIPAALRAGVEGFFIEREPDPANSKAIAEDCAWLRQHL
jgi:sugar phosphate isomerase/epimerase